MDTLETRVAEYLVSRGCDKKKSLEESKALLNFIRGQGHVIMTTTFLEEIKKRKTDEDKGAS